MPSSLAAGGLQRDLTDSTVMRNMGVPFGHSLLALKATQRGLGKMNVNEKTINADLDANWAVVAEATTRQRDATRQRDPDDAEKAESALGFRRVRIAHALSLALARSLAHSLLFIDAQSERRSPRALARTLFFVSRSSSLLCSSVTKDASASDAPFSPSCVSTTLVCVR